jgi:dephospho-CoA kinase
VETAPPPVRPPVPPDHPLQPLTSSLPPVLNVGLTGNVAAGKSTVAALFRRWGAWLVDADALAREAVAPGSPALATIAARFGADLVQADGTLDRAALRHRVMGVRAERAALNAIVHPEVGRLREREMARAAAALARIVVHDIPLLFEALDPAAFDAVVLVDAPVPVRRARLLGDRGLSPADADTLLAAQDDAATKRARSTFVIDNDGDRDRLEARALDVWRLLQARAGLG